MKKSTFIRLLSCIMAMLMLSGTMLMTACSGDPADTTEAPEPSEVASATILREVIERELNTLTPREAHVIKLRFGLYDGRMRTLEEVGKEFDITRERIRQIEAKALRKLRHPSRSKRLKDYLDQ